MRRNKRNGQPDEGVCDLQHTVHSDEVFVIRQHKRNGQPDQGVCDLQHTVHSNELFVIRQENRNGSIQQDVCDTRQIGQYTESLRRPIITQTIATNMTYVICPVYRTSGHCGTRGHPDTP